MCRLSPQSQAHAIVTLVLPRFQHTPSSRAMDNKNKNKRKYQVLNFTASVAALPQTKIYPPPISKQWSMSQRLWAVNSREGKQGIGKQSLPEEAISSMSSTLVGENQSAQFDRQNGWLAHTALGELNSTARKKQGRSMHTALGELNSMQGVRIWWV